MKEVVKPEEITFKDYYSSLEGTEKIVIRNKIISECGISYPSFYTKLKSNNYSILERKAIEHICNVSFNW